MKTLVLVILVLLSNTLLAELTIDTKEAKKVNPFKDSQLTFDEFKGLKDIVELEEPTKPRVYGVVQKESEVKFSIEKFKIGKIIEGEFKTYAGEVKMNNYRINYLNGRILVNSVDTGNDKRDTHLKSGDFFAVNNYPHIDFKLNAPVNYNTNQDFRATGYLTIKGKRKPVKIDMKVMRGEKGRYIIIGDTRIDRYDYGITWNKRIDKQEKSVFDTLEEFAKGLGDKYIIDKKVDIQFRLVLLPKS